MIRELLFFHFTFSNIINVNCDVVHLYSKKISKCTKHKKLIIIVTIIYNFKLNFSFQYKFQILISKLLVYFCVEIILFSRFFFVCLSIVRREFLNPENESIIFELVCILQITLETTILSKMYILIKMHILLCNIVKYLVNV